jgi:hypothetical protein
MLDFKPFFQVDKMEINLMGISKLSETAKKNSEIVIKRYKCGKARKLQFYAEMLKHRIDNTPRLRAFTL